MHIIDLMNGIFEVEVKDLDTNFKMISLRNKSGDYISETSMNSKQVGALSINIQRIKKAISQ